MQSNLTGQTLGKYELRELIGAGGMGAVYRAYDDVLKREVAVKVVNLGMGGAELQGRFIREAQTSANLEHSHIVRVYDYGVESDISYVVMQYLTGGSLSERMRQAAYQGHSRASLPEIALLLEHLGSALDYAHQQGVIHRDIKPQNIMFNNQGQAFIVDFGIAKILSDASHLTGTSTTVGTPSYMPPEQWGDTPLTPAADQYALAVVTYQLVSGRLPFEADSVPSLWYKIEKEDATPLHILRPDIPPSIMAVISRAMTKTPSERFPNCTQFAQAFASAIEGSPADSPGNYFRFSLSKSPGAGVLPFTTPPASTLPIPESTLPDTPTTRPPVNGQENKSASLPRAVYLAGLAALLLIALVALLLINNGGAEMPSALTLTAVNQTLIAAGLATDDQATLNTETDETAPAEEVIAPVPTEADGSAAPLPTESPPPTATPPENPPATEADATAMPDTPAPAVFVSQTLAATDVPTENAVPVPTENAVPIPTENVVAVPTDSPTDIHPATLAPPVTPENTGTAIAIFNATQQAIFDGTITGPAPVTDAVGTPASFAPTENAVAIVVTDAPSDLETPVVVPNTLEPSITPEPPATEAPPPAATQAPSDATVTDIPVADTVGPTATILLDTLPSGQRIAMQPGEGNADWTPVEEIFDGVPMVLVPSGCTSLGSDVGEPDEAAAHQVCIAAPFWLDATEVTQEQFTRLNGVAARASAFIGERRPVEQISWFEARDFCVARGGRLPTEAEWEYAARGPDGWTYPWGDEMIVENAVFTATSSGATTDVAAIPAGASWVGAYDMASNVWEWTSSIYRAYPYDAGDGREIDIGNQTDVERVVRGGSWRSRDTDLRAAKRDNVFPVNTLNTIGFRCARD